MTALGRRRVLVTRPGRQGDILAGIIEREGGIAIKLPMIEVDMPADLSIDKIREDVSEADILIFVSRNSADYFNRLLGNMGGLLFSKPVLAAGRGTAQSLETMGVTGVVFPEKDYGSEGLLKLDTLSGKKIKHKRVAIVRGNESREILEQELRKRGAEVSNVIVYRTSMPSVDKAHMDSIWEDSIPDIIVVTSVRGLKNLIKLTGTVYKNALFSRKLVVMSKRIADTAIQSGFVIDPVVAAERSDKGLLTAIKQCLERD